ncbi:MAG: insulinase family protein, partial [Micromonosporaceae bacterium]
IGFMGEPFEVRNPTALLLQAHLPPDGDVDKVLLTADEELDRLASDGLDDGELERVCARIGAQLLRDVDSVLNRTVQMAVMEQQRGADGPGAGLMNDLPSLVGQVTAEQVVAAAGKLRPQRRASVEVIPGGGEQ